MAAANILSLKTLAEAIPGAGFSESRAARSWAREAVGRNEPGVITYALSYRVCLDLRLVFTKKNNYKIEIHPDLWAWAKEEQLRREDLQEIMAAKRLDLPVLEREYPDMAKAMYERPFQTIGVRFAIRARRAIIADQPGLGKTLQATAAIVEDETVGAILVLAPAAASNMTWPDEFDAWFPNEAYYIVDGDTPTRRTKLDAFWKEAHENPDERTWCFMNFESLQLDRYTLSRTDIAWRPDGTPEPLYWKDEEKGIPRATTKTITTDEMRFPALTAHDWSAIIVDEGHRILPTSSSVADKQSQLRRNVQKLPVHSEHSMKLNLTGTPLKGDPLNLWGSLNWLAPKQHSAYWDWVNRWFEVVDGEWSKEIGDQHASATKGFGREIDAYMIRRTKAEVAPQLPAKVYAGNYLDAEDKTGPVGVWLDMEGKQRVAYDQMVEDAEVHLESGSLTAAGLLAEMTRCKQMACAYGDVEHVLKRVPGESFDEWVKRYKPMLPSNKWDWLQEFLRERGIWRPKEAWGEGKIIIAAWQTPLLKLMKAECDRLGVPSLILTGDTNNAARANAKATFQKPGGPRLFFLNTIAGGVSLTLDAADDMVVMDETWDPSEQEQVEDRIHRISRALDPSSPRPPATYWYVRSRGTIEEHIAAVTDGKDKIQYRLLDERRGVDYAKRLLIGG